MQVLNRLVTCLVVLLYNRVAAILTDEECAQYHELASTSDYATFVEDCAGKAELGFEIGKKFDFYASKLTETEFNQLFANAVKVSLYIHLENTNFVEAKLPKLRELVGGFSIRNNALLKTFRVNRAHKFSRTTHGPTTVTVDGNPLLSQESLEDLRYMCDYCDVFGYSKCSALEPVSPPYYDQLVSKCAGERIIKQKPGTRFYLNANKMTEQQFHALFSEATHVEMCINLQDIPWKRIAFPKLVRLIPCGLGDPALNIVHNPHLTAIDLPQIKSEGFGAKNKLRNIIVKNNFVLPASVIKYLHSYCVYCKLTPYIECDDLISEDTKNATAFTEKCGGKRIFKPRQGHVLFLDISRLSQDLVDELFMDVTYIKMCITLRASQIRELRMPHLKELHSCQEGRPAFIIEDNENLQGILISPEFKFDVDEYLFYIIGNRKLPPSIYLLFEECRGCVFEHQTRCGVDKNGYQSTSELLANCAGKRKIVFEYEIEVNEFQFQQLCSRAVHMKMCFKIVNTNYRQIRCPYLRYIEPCKTGMQVFKIVGNPLLSVVDIPVTVLYPKTEKILLVKKNQKLAMPTIEKLKKICPICEIEGYFSKCSGLGPITDVDAFVRQCTGQPFIDGREGVILQVDLSKLTEQQINALFAEVVEMKICVTISGSSVKRLIFPKLTRWTTCAPGRPALILTYNFVLESVLFPSCKQGCINGAVIQHNPALPKNVIDVILGWCTQCVVEYYVPSCGLGIGGFSMLDFVAACAGKPFIKPEGVEIEIDSSKVPEEVFNAFCSKAVYMEVCIVISDSSYRSIRCPHLREIKPCAPGKPVFKIVNNLQLVLIDIPQTIVFTPDVIAFIIQGNPLLPPKWMSDMKNIMNKKCPKCIIEEATGCGLAPTEYTDKQLVQACAGKTVIRPAIGFFLTVSSQKVTEDEMNKMCSNVVFMEICITITESRFKALRCPRLKQLKSCLPGRPAITIVDNPFFEVIDFPITVVYPKETPIIKIQQNPMLNPTIPGKYKPWCPHCTILPDYVCGITKPNFTTKELIAACAGKKFIKPAKGIIVVVKSSEATEMEINLICSKAVYMEICIEIIDSPFRSLRCPYLKELRPCEPNRPAIKIVNNKYFNVLVIPSDVVYPPGALIIQIERNPMLSPSIIDKLLIWCKHCPITLAYACGLTKPNFTMKELVLACADYEYIRPPPGVILVITSDMVTEAEINRMCAKAVYMEICIEIKNSKFKSLRCPNLKELKPCQQGRPAITIEYNPFFEVLLIPSNVKYPPGANIVKVQRNPSLRPDNINQLQRWCPHCTITVDYVCGISTPKFTIQQVVAACAGQIHIVPSPGVVLVIQSKHVTEAQMNALCSKVEIMQICIEITSSMYKSLRCPNLKELRPCQPGRPAIKIVDNPYFVILEIPKVVVFPIGALIIEVRKNPMLPPDILEKIRIWCPGCVVVGDYACGLNKRSPSTKELMSACVGRLVVIPMPGDQLILHSKDFTEPEFNAFCSKVVYMKACITIEKSMFKSLRCPHLKELRPCQPGKSALTIVENFNLEIIVIPPSLKVVPGELVFVIRDNPRLPLEILLQLQRLCPGCSISMDTDCGLTRPFTVKQLVVACANKVVIKPSKGYIIEITSNDVDEAKMNAMCARAVYMEVCITISASTYKEFKCPVLRELRPCAPGRVAIKVIDNPHLIQFFIPLPLIYPSGAIILELAGNPLLPWEIVQMYREKCRQACRFPTRNACVLQARNYLNKELVSTCAGKSIIKPLPGYHLMVSSQYVTEGEMNALCAKAVYMEICIVIIDSQFRSLRCPYLKGLKSCRPDKPAITVVNNLNFIEIQIPSSITYPKGFLIFEFTGNPRLPPAMIQMLKRICPHCRITSDYDCGLTRPFTVKQLVAACAGKVVIQPTPGYMIDIYSKDITEDDLNAFCSKVVYLEACITISASKFRSFRCPNLRELKSCQPGRPAIRIINNAYLKEFEIPFTIIIPSGVMIFEIYGNPLLPLAIIQRLREICPACRIPTDDGECKLESRSYSDKELVALCAGKKKIRPAVGFYLTVSSQFVTEAEMNALCSKATHMEICITIIESQFKSLRCPHLKELKPCKPGEPAIKIIRNLHFTILEIPSTVIVPSGELIFQIEENPNLSLEIIAILKKICPQCRITANLACDLEGRSYTDKELIAACAGKTIIKPAPGWILVLSSDKTTEDEMNALCSKAVYMEICIEITKSAFKKLRCPHLKELRPCQPGRPAIKIVNNLNFELLEIPYNVVYPKKELILEIGEVPRMATPMIKQLKKICPACKITANLGCGLTKRNYSDAEMVAACAGKTIIKPAEGYMLVMSSDTVSEQEMNAVCSKAVYMEICIIIRNSQFKSFNCPHLRELKSCKPGVPAIRIVGNPHLRNVSISKTLLYRIGTKTLEIRGNPKLSMKSIKALNKLCPECVIRRQP